MDREPGADVSLIEHLLELSPEERLRLNDRMVASIEELRRAFAAAAPPHARVRA